MTRGVMSWWMSFAGVWNPKYSNTTGANSTARTVV